MVLESVHLANNVFGEGAASEDEIDFEEEIIVDYLDEVSSSNKGDPLIVRHLVIVTEKRSIAYSSCVITV